MGIDFAEDFHKSRFILEVAKKWQVDITDWSDTLLVDSYESFNVYQSSGSKYYNYDLNTYLKDFKKEFSVVQGKKKYHRRWR